MKTADELAILQNGAALLGAPVSERQAAALLRLLDELTVWNRAYNLTAISDRSQMLTHHLLDSLAADPWIVGPEIADVGTGAGFPGLPLAIRHPEWRFTLIDSNAKKIRFINHVVRTLGIANVQTRHARAEQRLHRAPFDTVVARALAELPKLLVWVRPLCGAATRVVALKGPLLEQELAGIPPGWRLLENVKVQVPGLAATRHVVTLQA